MAKKFLTPIGLVSLPSDPADGIEGQLYFNTTSDIIKVYANGSWAVLQGGGSNEDTINTASAAAFNSASANTVSQINALTTSDIEEGSRLYYTNTRGLTTASTALVHNNHTNITAAYNSASNQIILTGTAGGGGAGGDGASVIYSTEQPDTSQLSIGDIWVDSNASVGYSGSSAPFVNQLTFWLEDNYGNLLPDADNIYSVGSSAFRVKDLYLGPNSLYIKSPNSNTNIPITIDSNNDVTFNGSKLITVANAENSLLATQSYARSASANALSSASAYTNAQLATIDLSSLIQTASAAAVNYLIDGAPAALDTINELAEALNDNADILDLYLTQSNASSTYLTQSNASSTYLTQSNASSTYSTISNSNFTGTSLFVNAQVNGILDVQEIREQVIELSIGSGSATANFNNGGLFYISTAPSSNFVLNLINVPNVNLKSQTVSIVVTQGATGYIPNIFMLDGVSQTIRWLGGSAPTPTSSAGKIDIFNFTVFRTSSSTLIIANSNLNI